MIDPLTPEQARERDLYDDCFNPVESDEEYLARRQRQLAAREAGVPTMLRCAGCGGRYEDAPGNYCSFCVTP